MIAHLLAFFVIDDILYYVAIAGAIASAAGTYASYEASQQQAKQSRMNADAQVQGIAAEQQRQQLEANQAQQRKIMEQRRFTASQENALAGTGFLATTGTPIDILADTYTAQQREIRDIGYQNDTNEWQLGTRAQAAISEGYSQSGAIKSQAGGTLLSNVGSTSQSYLSAYKARAS